MKDMKGSITGGICSIAAGALILVYVITYFCSPAEQSATTPQFSPAYFASINETFIFQEIIYWGLILGAVFGIGVVTTVTDRVREGNRDLAAWISVLAYIGFGIQILCNVLGREYVTKIAPYYESLIPEVQAIYNIQGHLFNDWIAFGLVGSWFIMANYCGLRKPWYPNVLAVIGLCAGVGYWFVPLGNIFHVEILISIAAGAAIVLAPLWYFGMGVLLLRKGKTALGTSP